MKRTLAVLAVVGLGCSASSDVESQITITQGVYGRLSLACTGEGCVGAARVGVPVGWFASNPFAADDAGVRPTALRETSSGVNGFYELALDSGVRGYLAIGETQGGEVQYLTATSAAVPRGLARIDWHAGPGREGTWTEVQ